MQKEQWSWEEEAVSPLEHAELEVMMVHSSGDAQAGRSSNSEEGQSEKWLQCKAKASHF